MTAPLLDDRRVLDRTARSFALSIRALPRGLREPVEVAYLLARAADTVADSGGGHGRGRLLARVRESLDPGAAGPPDLADVTGALDPAERALLLGFARLWARWRALPAEDGEDVADVVRTLVATMEHELAFFAEGRLEPLPSAAALERYTEGIAGCVGAFWTRLGARHVRGFRGGPAMERLGRRYGRGLQLVNVVRDLPRDLRRGRCFLPRPDLAAAGLDPERLRDGGPAVAEALVGVLLRWESRARLGLVGGLLYASRVPAGAFGMRLATALPAALGIATLDRLAAAPAAARLDPAVPIRVPRRELRALAARTAWWCLFPRGPLRLARTRFTGNV